MTAGATQSSNSPGVDDLAFNSGYEHEAGIRDARRCEARLPIFMHNAQKHHPSSQFTTAYE
jgi:hypothetical protein